MIKRKTASAAVIVVTVAALLAGCGSAVESGVKALEEKDYETALESFEKAIDKDDNIAEAYRGAGICYWEAKEYEKALEAFENAVASGAETTAVLYNMMGICELKTGSPTKAAYYFETGLTKEDASDELRQEMAFQEIAALEKAENYTEARQKLEQYAQKYPDDERAAKELEFLKTQAPE